MPVVGLIHVRGHDDPGNHIIDTRVCMSFALAAKTIIRHERKTVIAHETYAILVPKTQLYYALAGGFSHLARLSCIGVLSVAEGARRVGKLSKWQQA